MRSAKWPRQRAEAGGAHRRADQQQDRLGAGVVAPDVVGQRGAGHLEGVGRRLGRRAWSRCAPRDALGFVSAAPAVDLIGASSTTASSARIASIWPTASVRPSSMPMARTCSIASVLGKTLCDRHPRPAAADLLDRDARRSFAGMSVFGVPSALAKPSRNDEPARRIDLDDLPVALRLVALGPGHVVLDAAAGREVVRGEGGGVGRRAPPALELARVGPQLPDALGRGVELGVEGHGQGLRGPCGRR